MAIGEMKVIGKAVPILEARDKVTGRAEYVDDMKTDLFVTRWCGSNTNL